MQKTKIVTALMIAMGGTAHAAQITSMTLSDVWDSGLTTTHVNGVYNVIGGARGSDGSIGRFGFNEGTTSHFSGDTGRDILFGGANQGAGVFTTGFIFANETFEPNTSATFDNSNAIGSGISGTVDASGLNISNVDFGSLFAGVHNWYFAADPGTIKTNFFNDLGNGDYEVAFSWSHQVTTAEDPSVFGLVCCNARWVLEGVVHTVPVPAAVW